MELIEPSSLDKSSAEKTLSLNSPNDNNVSLFRSDAMAVYSVEIEVSVTDGSQLLSDSAMSGGIRMSKKVSILLCRSREELVSLLCTFLSLSKVLSNVRRLVRGHDRNSPSE